MPIIKKRKIMWGSDGFVMVIKYSTGKEEFSIELPPEIQRVTKKTEVWAKTQKEAVSKFHSELADFENISTIKTKMIAYSLEKSIYTTRGEKDYHCSRYSYGSKKETGLQFDYQVIIKTEFKDAVSYEDLDGDAVYGMDFNHIVEWSQKREDFFKKFHTSLEDLIIAVIEFFGEDDQDAISKIDSGLALLAKN